MSSDIAYTTSELSHIHPDLLCDVLLVLKKKPTKGKGALKNINMKCLLKASATHLEDAGFRQAAVEELFSIHLEAARILQQSCAFPDALIPLLHPLKMFIKKCRNPDFARLFKSLEMKLKEQANFAREILDTTSVDLTDEMLLKELASRLRSAGAPLTKFYDSWQNVWKMKEAVTAPDWESGGMESALLLVLYFSLQAKGQDYLQAETVVKAVKGTKVVERRATRSVIKASAAVVEKHKTKRRKKQKGTAPVDDAEEDVLEDLVLSDPEN
ncbi:unnamed protein product [Gongylonema pulchrum]|uniref:Uncharacterized protein n=1 Tax=Gongylonema pulchrum TaxID=637853 RepID=A0A3P7RAC8_9BILA|nr:unnamed protein product [Gongylonema pulchrum]